MKYKISDYPKLGLWKDPTWFRQVVISHAKEGYIIHRRLGYPGAIKPGEHRSPETEFKKKMCYE